MARISLAPLQGVAGAVALAAGIWLALGVGPALVAVGLVLLFAAWSAS